MIDENLYTSLEYEICNFFSNSKEFKGFWCDGVTYPFTNYLAKKYVNKNREINMSAFIGKTEQTPYILILKFGNKALNRYMRNLSILRCIPKPLKEDSIYINIEKKEIIIQLF